MRTNMLGTKRITSLNSIYNILHHFDAITSENITIDCRILIEREVENKLDEIGIMLKDHIRRPI